LLRITNEMMPRAWWQDAVFYQIYPRSFADSNGDGIGDLDGITAHLDYLGGTPDSLGIDALWLSPINPSPNRDWGYDVSDYCDVHPELGDLAGFDRLVAEAHRRGIRVVLDLVPNHTSDEHPWFVESRASRQSARRDWYIWRPGRNSGPPNNWLSTFGGPAWEHDERTGEWYLHSFLKQQPDLNHRNPEVVEAMHDVLRFWLDRGADGFRVDVISYLMKDAEFRDNPPRTDDLAITRRDPHGLQLHLHDQDVPEVHEVIRGFRRVIDSYAARMMVGEVWPRAQEHLRDYLAPDECNLVFNFAFLRQPWSAEAFREAVEATESLLGTDAWPTYTLSNHDFARHVSRYAAGDATAARARVAAMMLLTLRGTPFLYYGEEIGMRQVEVPVERRRDRMGRDGCRTPMQWSVGRSGGFTSAREPWLPLGDTGAVNVEAQAREPGSLFALYRSLLRLRRSTRALREGRIRIVERAPEGCFVFARETGDEAVIVALNFTAEPRDVTVGGGPVLLSTADALRQVVNAGTIRLGANEGVIVAAR
jgi:alpha-glucosidase